MERKSNATNPICASGWRQNSVRKRRPPYAKRNMPVTAPGGRGRAAKSHVTTNSANPSVNA